MAKQAKRPKPVVDVKPGADPNAGNVLLSRRMGTVLGGACLLMYILFDQLWIGTVAFAIGFAVIFGLQVFYEKSTKWYASFNLYASIVCFVLAYAEYNYGILTNIMTID